LNGRIDLTQAESVIDVINAKNEFSLKSSLNQLNGSVLAEIRKIREKILHEIAFIESALDDPEHMELDSYPQTIHNIVDKEMKKIEKIIESFDNGRILKEGINTVIVGKPNVGKSSLLNLLVGQERAIVTDIAGTTRDVLEEQINLNGVLLNLMDTAGIRDTEDLVEQIGVDRAREYAAQADLVIYVIDASTELDESDVAIMELLQDKQTIILLNKSDLAVQVTEENVRQRLNKKILSISAKEEIGLEQLEETIREMFFRGEVSFNDEIYAINARQKHSLETAHEHLQQVIVSIEDGMPEDFYSIDLMGAYEELGKIIGESVEDDLVDEIFSKFCMGK
jgi:tRNA modification GTPase